MRSVRVIFCGLSLACLAMSAGAAEKAVMLTATKLYTAPNAEPLKDALVLIRDGKIESVGTRDQMKLTARKLAPACDGGTVLAGFQNSHVHFIEPSYADAKSKSAAALASQIESMLTRFGFTTVVDTASDPKNTFVIRQRIERGEILGPRILTVGAGVFPPGGLPVYISDLPREFLDTQLMPTTAEEARRVVRHNLDQGADATKLFVATPQADHSLKRMSLDVARAAAEVTHSEHKLVMVHATDFEGVRLALAAKADVLVHTVFEEESPWPQDMLDQLLSTGTTIAPTFKLFSYELKKGHVPEDVIHQLVMRTVEQFKPFVSRGGKVIFGTDVGYMSDYDPTDEYALMARAGMTTSQILASLTTEPAGLWKESDRRGKIQEGMDADLVVLGSDPADDVRNFTDVRCSIRAGKVIYLKK